MPPPQALLLQGPKILSVLGSSAARGRSPDSAVGMRRRRRWRRWRATRSTRPPSGEGQETPAPPSRPAVDPKGAGGSHDLGSPSRCSVATGAEGLVAGLAPVRPPACRQ
uniref:Uncharacterized protein n=1 Tax=Arundo donax TaxID=35708 RepID=A0A0A9GFB4_ARUDO